jgi:alanine racemase
VLRDTQRAWVEVDVAAVARNAMAIARHSGARLLPMVKADAYGLGLRPVVRALEPLDPWGYGVATVGEGEEIRALGITRPVLLFTPVLQAEHDRSYAAGLTLALGDADSIAAWGRRGGDWHLAIDTGMARAGVGWRAVATLREMLEQYPPSGVFTHFHSADTTSDSIVEQEKRFDSALRSLPAVPALVHTDNSAAVVRRGRSSLPLVRPGIFLYGAGAVPDAPLRPEPVVSVLTRVVDIRDAAPGDTVSYGATYALRETGRIATVPYGHADGYPVALSGRGSALVNGARVGVAGRVTMDMTMIDVSGVACARGDAVTFIGRDGSESITVDDVAAAGGVSPYELLVRLRNRITRVYARE